MMKNFRIIFPDSLSYCSGCVKASKKDDWGEIILNVKKKKHKLVKERKTDWNKWGDKRDGNR